MGTFDLEKDLLLSQDEKEPADKELLEQKPEKTGGEAGKKEEAKKEPQTRHPEIKRKLKGKPYRAQKILLKPSSYSASAKGKFDSPAAVESGFKQGEKGEVPYKKDMEESFGVSLDGVGAFKGKEAGASATALGASAYTYGDKIAFRDAAPSKELVAHEVTHVIQQKSEDAGGLSTGVDALEKEADGAAAIAAGGGFVPAVTPSLAGFVQCKQDDKQGVQAKAKSYAAQIREAFRGMGTTEDVVYRHLNHPPEMVRAIRDAYNSYYNDHTGKGLVEDIKDEFGDDRRELELCLGLLSRADISSGAGTPQYIKQEEGGGYKSDREITATPNVPVAVPGTKVSYQVGSKTGYIYATGSYFSYEWYCLNDPETCKRYGAPAMVKGPNSGKWDAKWDFEGNHKVICKVQFHPKGQKPETPRWVEYQQTVMKDAALLEAEFKKADVSPDPKKQYEMMEQYKNLLLMAEQQKGSKKLDPESKKGMDEYLKGMKEKLKSTEGKKRVGIKAVHVSREDARVSNLNAFVSKVSEGAGYEEWVLVDITNPVDRRLTGEYRGRGRTALEAINKAINDWDGDNRYPDGILKLEISKDAAGVTLTRQFQTDGMSFWDSISEFFNNVGLVAGIVTLAAAVITAVIPDPTISKVASAALWTAILAGTTSAVINIAQRRAEGVVDLKADLFDSMTIAGNILGGAWMRGAKVLSASKAGCRFATGIIIGKAATDAVQGILIAEAFIKEYDEIMKDTDPEKRTSRLITFLGKVSATGAMVIISFKSSADDLQKVGLSKTNLDAAKLGNPSETVDLAAKAKTPGTPDVEVKPQPVKTVDADNPLKLKIDDLMTSDAAQKKLFDLAMKTTDDMDSRLKSIASKYEGAEPISTIKRKDIKDFINEVKIKCAREKYPTVGDMGDMSRGRINLKGAADVVKAKDDIVKMFEGKIEKLKPPREPYPRWHVVIKHDTGLLYEIQIGTHATTTFLEKVIVKLPEAFMKAMGKSKPDIDFHDVMYKGLMKFKGTAIWGKYSMDDFVARYDRILKATGEGVLDDAVNKALQKEIQGILDRIASEDADILKTVFKK